MGSLFSKDRPTSSESSKENVVTSNQIRQAITAGLYSEGGTATQKFYDTTIHITGQQTRQSSIPGPLNQIRQATTACINNEGGGTATMNVSDSTFNITGQETRQSSIPGLSDVEWKQTVFGDTIRSDLGKLSFNNPEQLSAIYESNNDKLITSLPCLPDLSGHHFGRDDAFMFASLLARRGKEREVNLRGCGINDKLIDVMIENWEDEIIRVEELELSYNFFTIWGLNSILTHLDVDIIRVNSDLMEECCYEDLDWDNIREIEWGPWITMINDEETITIEGRVQGRYIKTLIDSHTEKQLSLDIWEANPVELVIDVIQFFQQKFVEVTIKEEVYLTPDILIRMKSMELKGEISQMVVNCKSKKNVDVSSIDFCIQNLRPTHVDIVVDDYTSFDPCDFLRDIGSHVEMNSVNIKVHWWFQARTTEHVTNVVQVVQRNHVENLWHYIYDVYHTITPEDVLTVIKNCSELKKLTLVYRNYGRYENEEMDLQNYCKIIKRRAEGIEVEVLSYKKLSDSWEKVIAE